MFEPNENLIKKILLEIFYYQTTNKKFGFGSQNIIKSNKFFDYVSYLKINGLINVCRYYHNQTFYTLTDRGELEAILYAKRSNVDNKYKFLAYNINYDISQD